MTTKHDTKEIGRRLLKGPPQVVASQAACGNKQQKATSGRTPSRQPKREWKRTPKPSQTSLNILQLNICGLSNKKTELAQVLNTHKVHVALLQESLHTTANTHITGYTSYSCACKSCRGITTYIRNDTTAECSHLRKNEATDSQKCTVWHNGKKYTIYNVYSPPATKCSMPDLQNTIYRSTVIAGDFNGHSPKWGYQDRNETGKVLEELNETTNLDILQNELSPPTLLHRAHKTLSRPDLTIVSSDLSPHCQVQVLPDVGGSDHKPILTKIFCPARTPATTGTRVRWNFRKAKWLEYTSHLETSLENFEKETDISTTEENFSTALLQAAKKHIPRGNPKKYKPFWSKNIARVVLQRRKAREELEKDPNPYNKTNYNRATAIAKRTIAMAKKAKWSETCSSLDLRKDSKKAWTLLNRLSGQKTRTNPSPMPEAENAFKRAEKLNKFFSSVNKSRKNEGTHLQLLKELQERKKQQIRNTNQLFENPFSLQELEDAIRKLKLKKSPGPDKIHNEMLKNLGPNGKKALLCLINQSWETGHLPKTWKNAHINPILKKNKDPKEEKSYRPISLTSCVGKTAERMINRRLYWWLETRGLLSEAQAGFRAGSRTEDQLFRLHQSIQDSFQEEKQTVAVFVDLQQAYDRVWRKGLLLKMLRMGITGNLFHWIKNFLMERTIQTSIDQCLSSKQVLEEGLPQGSVLSCTLFLIYINDMPEDLKTSKALYADDLVLWTSHRYIRQSARHMNRDLETLSEYCKKWKLSINPTKTVYTTFTLSPKVSQRDLDIRLDGKSVAKETSPTYLGVQLDSRLNLSRHIENTKEKATKRLALIKRLASTKWGANMTTLRTLYIGYVRSILDYNNCLQIACSKSNQQTLDRVQNHALRIVCGGMRSTPTAACEIQANIEPLEMRREKAALEMFERSKRMPTEHPCRKLVDNWKPKTRIKQKSVLHHAKELAKKHHLPPKRAPCPRASSTPPNLTQKQPEIVLHLKNKNTNKGTDPLELKRIAEDTISDYPEEWIHTYTDGSAFKGTTNAGYGVWIRFPNGDSISFSSPCGLHCSNCEAELLGIQAALDDLNQTFRENPNTANNIVLYTDSKSALQMLENGAAASEEVQRILQISNELVGTYSIRVVLQWIPGHTNIYGNDKADRLAKQGAFAQQPQRPATLQTVKQILKENCKEDWMNQWATGSTGRAMYQQMNTVKKNDCLREVERKHQCNIFRLRTQHAPVNYHLNQLKPEHPPRCPLCDHPRETVQHLLFQCPKLRDLRQKYLPPLPDTSNTLYSTTNQLRKTSTFYDMAFGRRAKAQLPLD